MTKVVWDQVGEREYETGVSHGVLYVYDNGSYGVGVPWNGLTGVTESPSGAEATALYADNIKYLNLVSAEEFGATIEAYTYPDEFALCDGTATPTPGVAIGQQNRKTFGFTYRTEKGNDTDATDHGYKIHLVYGALAAPSEKAYSTINDTPEAITFSWTVTTTPVAVTGHKPSAILTIDSTKVSPSALSDLEDLIYGTAGTDPVLPMPDTVIALFAGDAPTELAPNEPSFTAATGEIVIPTQVGVEYFRGDTGAVVTGTVTIAVPGESLLIRARPESADYAFYAWADDDWSFTRDP